MIKKIFVFVVGIFLVLNSANSQTELQILKTKIKKTKVSFSVFNAGELEYTFNALSSSLKKEIFYPHYHYLQNDTLIIEIYKYIDMEEFLRKHNVTIDGEKSAGKLKLFPGDSFKFVVITDVATALNCVKLIFEDRVILFNSKNEKSLFYK